MKDLPMGIMRISFLAGTAAFMSVLSLVRPLRAQEEATVEAIAPILMAEDARRWAPEVYQRGLEHPDPLVRRTAATAIGRVRDGQGGPLLIAHIRDVDSTVQAQIMFALGLLQDTSNVAPIIARFSDQPGLWREAAQEGITALAKMGGPEVARFFSGILRGTQVLTVDSVPLVRLQVARELWRLGPRAPVVDLVPFLRDTLIDLRQAAVYSAGRLRSKEAGPSLLVALRDEVALTRSWAARALTRSYADSAALSADAVISGLRGLLADDDPGVRINVIRSLGTFARPELSRDIAGLLGDPDVNTRVQAANTLGATGGPAAAEALANVLRSREVFAVRREALLSLARVDTVSFLKVVPQWSSSADWRDRMVAVQAWGTLPPGPHPGKPELIDERDGRVIAAALQAWASGSSPADLALAAQARRLIVHQDAAVRSVAADILANVHDPADLTALIGAYRKADRDSFPDAQLSALAAIDSIAHLDNASEQRVEHEFLEAVPRPSSYLIRRWAETSWPAATERWGPAYPLENSRTLEDYRQIARAFMVGNDPSRYPHVFLETEQRGIIELELFGPDAPLTVANFLMLIDRHYFDGNSWHRVVPNFVVQDGDRRGDGFGGPGGEIRDEINRRRYGTQVLGMALSGPDTGSSQWFITHSPQPHLDGIYTVFGRVVGGGAALARISQGDRINTIRR
jgi:cyclophilin family peptidyl-prolyl cis-trans isomerase/HEAT repeat protein